MKRIYVIESLCNGCRLCEAFCSSLADGVFGAADLDGSETSTGLNRSQSRIRVIKVPGEEQDVPMVDCSGLCIRPIYDDGHPTCVSLCPTGALIYEERDDAAAKRLELEAARQEHSLFKVIAPWKWPLPWSGGPAAADGD
jgi:Fe-S-cluster-containing dehydrogenase component